MPQHGAFFAADADCAAITRAVPWTHARLWLELLAASGTPLFLSHARDALGSEQREAVRAAFALAASGTASAEPLDWLGATCPRRWRLGESRDGIRLDEPGRGRRPLTGPAPRPAATGPAGSRRS